MKLNILTSVLVLYIYQYVQVIQFATNTNSTYMVIYSLYMSIMFTKQKINYI